ncbi:hypothetical protein EV198_1869 [Roseivirga ehrenbergii]|uniref:Uncharacterized protein n=1 Tax=Roseivirga ehrenbergii (strain DSM 102268 / JCM 13514 / KCTC 12282 / NCIMB 14502 / KMM 6017) TaxID=279360 RepID=A0A150XST6_ROSEK|nr:hypothetical protein [Roseivirga ehrenbergii]KYG81662.1 hypothetical protein MB14_13855 [Roseivirga ehrenbergii]TCL10837.1 hypothetical protein EV198_1869 [Roseivirga ehrenbergii]
MIIQEISQGATSSGPVWADSAILAAAIGAIGAFIVGIVSLILNYKTHKEQITEKRKEERRQEIYKKLNDFYGPFQSYLNASKEFYKIFMVGKPAEFRTLTFLLNKEQEYQFQDGTTRKVALNQTDKELLEQILYIGQKLEDLIIEKAGLVDDPELRYDFRTDADVTDAALEGNGLLAFAKTHFQIIRLAHLGKFSGEIDRFKNYVFPRQLPIKIEERIVALQNEIKELKY